jgi:hypothetical protein
MVTSWAPSAKIDLRFPGPFVHLSQSMLTFCLLLVIWAPHAYSTLEAP